ncbi:MAG: hypothetical protein IMW94_01400 [Thermoanaerobacter sp.]|nr:hypothetical protein [Thermoanaerobacter sp.]
MRNKVRFSEPRRTLRGVLELVIRRRGRIVEVYKDPNLIVDAARVTMARMVSGESAGLAINRIAVGTNPAPPSPADTAITNAFIKPVSGYTHTTPTSTTFNFIILESEANGMAIVEFGLLCTDGSLFARRTRGVIEKAEDLEIEGQWTILF